MTERSIRAGIGRALVELGANDKRLVVLCADLRDSLRLKDFAEAYPERFLEMGVAEQNMVGVAAGLAAAGMRPVIASYAAFMPGRTHDQVRTSIALPNLPVLMIGGHAGLTVGADGATHQALEDLALMRVLPNVEVAMPMDFETARQLTSLALTRDRPVYIRSSRVASKDIKPIPRLAWGKWPILSEGKDLTVVVAGTLYERAMMALQGSSFQIILATTVKPLDEIVLAAAARDSKAILVLEDHQQAGGLGSAIAEWTAQNSPILVKSLGIADRFGRSGNPDSLLDAFGLSVEAIAKEAHHLLAKASDMSR